MSKKRFWQFRASADNPSTGDLLLYGEISSETWWGDEVTPKAFKQDLDALGDVSDLNVYINSGGGDVFAGQAIYSMLKRHPAKVTVYVDGLAASIASVIAMAGDVVRMPRNAMMMVHNPWTYAVGNADDFRKLAEDLDKMRDSLLSVYQDKTGLGREDIIPLLDAETWMTADDAVAQGFADEIEETKQVAASMRSGALLVNGQRVDLSRFRNRSKVAALVKAAAADPEDDEDDEEGGPAYDVGDQIRVTGIPHVEGHQTGVVREAMLTWVYGVAFDGMEAGGIYHWYAESELGPNPDPAPDEMDEPGPANRTRTKVSNTSPAERRTAPLSLYERRLQTNER